MATQTIEHDRKQTSEKQAEQIPGTELIEVSPAVHDLIEQVRVKVGMNSLQFYRRVLRAGALTFFGNEGSTYGLIGTVNKAFLEDSPRAKDGEALQSLRRIADRNITELVALKRKVTAL